MRRSIISIILFCAISLTVCAQKNDTIYLSNGDRLTGELKKVETGLVFLKTDAFGTVKIEVEKINTAYSKKYYEFRTTSGFRYFGAIQRSTTPGMIEVISTGDTIPKPMWDLVTISPINQRIFQRIDGSIDLGLNYTKSIDVFQYNLDGWVSYRSENIYTKLEVTSILSESRDDQIARNNDLGINITRYLPNKWFTRLQVDAQQNTELNLEHRFQMGPTIGYDIVRTTPMRLYSLAGVLLNQEKLIEPEEKSINVEGLFSLYYSWDRYKHPKVDISSGLDIYPSLTDLGRIRVEYDASIKYEILMDVFFTLSDYYNFDNQPSAGIGDSKNDYGIITSVGYTF